IADLQHATTLDPTDASSLALLGDLHEARGETDAALNAYERSIALDADPAVEAKRDAIRAQLARARLPEQYRAIDASAQITRADLAALIGVRLGDLIATAPQREVGILTDVRGNWAESW